MSGPHEHEYWIDRLNELCSRLRKAVGGALAADRRGDGDGNLARPVSSGLGDETFGLDVPSETVCTEWLREIAATRPLSLLTEEAGWRHMGPRAGVAADLKDFSHGGPRIAIDPIDGTRNLMADLRSAWTVISLAPAGAVQPRLSDLTLGIVSELPHTRMSAYRSLRAVLGQGCRFEERTLIDDQLLHEGDQRTDGDDRSDHGYFPFFRYDLAQAPRITAIECEFHRLLARHEASNSHNCYDDQYISNGGQLVLLSGGQYRFIADLRAWLAQISAVPATTSKPYDSAGAILCAREAGAVVEAPDGSRLDFPLDATTPVSFVGWVNAATRARLQPHLAAALAATTPDRS